MILDRKPPEATLRRCVNQLKDLLILDEAGRVQIVHTSFRDYLENALKERDKKGTS
jgi:nucleoside-triphosphatase THEP1